MARGARSEGRWRVMPVAPLIVAVIGLATALTIALLALAQLQEASDEAAELRSKALAQTLAARMRTTEVGERSTLLAQAARRSGADLLLVDTSGAIVVDHSLKPLDEARVQRLLDRGTGLSDSAGGRAWFAAHAVDPPFEHLSVMTFVGAPAPAVGSIALTNAVAVLTLLLLGIAIGVALVFVRAARDDVAFVRQRIDDMAQGELGAPGDVSAAPLIPLVPIRALDQVGLLTASLNVLVERFTAAETAYREDLRQKALADEARSQFLAGLSHELRTPLNAILGFTHLLESEDDGPLSDDAKEALAQIRQSGEHLSSLIADILDLSAMETGQLRLSRGCVDVYQLAEQVVTEASATLKERPHVELVLDGDRSARAWGDARRLRQVLTNLVSNALKFTARGQVRVHVAADAREVVLTVSDSGSGIARGQLRSIFEAYQQAGDAGTRRRGAGLGLAIAQRIVRMHGGRIEVRSEVDKGSDFVVRVPDESRAAELPADGTLPIWESDTPPPLKRVKRTATGRRA